MKHSIPLSEEGCTPLSFVDLPLSLYISGKLAVYELNQIELLRDLFVWNYCHCCALYMQK